MYEHLMYTKGYRKHQQAGVANRHSNPTSKQHIINDPQLQHSPVEIGLLNRGNRADIPSIGSTPFFKTQMTKHTLDLKIP